MIRKVIERKNQILKMLQALQKLHLNVLNLFTQRIKQRNKILLSNRALTRMSCVSSLAVLETVSIIMKSFGTQMNLVRKMKCSIELNQSNVSSASTTLAEKISKTCRSLLEIKSIQVMLQSLKIKFGSPTMASCANS